MDLERDVAGRIWQSPRLWEDFAALCAIGGRFAGSESEAQGVAFLRERLAEIAGDRVAVHEVPYDGWARRSCRLTLLGGAGRPLAAHSLVWSPDARVEGEVVDLGRGTPEDFAARGEAIAGRVVLVRHEYMFASGHIHRRRKYLIAKERGAKAFLIASPLPGQALVTGSSGTGGPDDIPAAGITQEGAALLAGGARIRLEIEAARASAVARNLIAEIPGRADEWVVLSAHIDGHDLGESALDNGTGLAVALEVARVLAPIVPQLRRGLRIGFFTIEEWGLAGSRAYCDALSEAECDRIALNVNLDSVAGSPRLAALTSGFAELEPFLAGIAGRLGVALDIHPPLMANSDHYNFARRGIPAFRLVAGFDEPQSNLRYVLTSADTIDKAAPLELKSAALLTASIVLAACAAESPPARRKSAEEVARLVG